MNSFFYFSLCVSWSCNVFLCIFQIHFINCCIGGRKPERKLKSSSNMLYALYVWFQLYKRIWIIWEKICEYVRVFNWQFRRIIVNRCEYFWFLKNSSDGVAIVIGSVIKNALWSQFVLIKMAFQSIITAHLCKYRSKLNSTKCFSQNQALVLCFVETYGMCAKMHNENTNNLWNLGAYECMHQNLTSFFRR